MSDRYEAKLDDFTLDCETLEDSFEKSIPEAEFPYRDGALTGDMGQKARKITIKCYFYNEHYYEHFSFIEHLKKRTLFEFVHPKYGLIKGRIKSVAIKHDDRKETAEVDISFVEHMRGEIEPKKEPEVVGETESAFTNGQSELQDDARKNFLDKARDFMAQIEKYKRRFDSILKDVANPASSLINMVNYATDTPGEFIGSIAKCVERYAELYNTLKDAPTRFLGSLQSATEELASAFESFFDEEYRARSSAEKEAAQFAGEYARAMGAMMMALQAAYMYKADEQKRNMQRQREQTKSFDSRGNYTAQAPQGPIMSIDELELSLAIVRQSIQRSVDEMRGIESLKAMARTLQEHVDKIKLERERIITVNIDGVLPLHLVCLKHSLPYNYAERILTINPQIKNPNFVSGEVRIYAG